MSIIIPTAVPGMIGYDPAKGGCTECGTQDTVSFDGRLGRRCAQHAPTFDVEHCVELAAAGFPGAAIAYIRATA